MASLPWYRDPISRFVDTTWGEGEEREKDGAKK
jgi:hypothetical protein